MASLRKAKKQAKKEGRVFVDPTASRKKLLRSVNQNVKETNRRLRALDRKGFYNSFSSKKLFDRLGGRINALQKINNKVVGINIRKNMNITELTAIQKATNNFLASATSTPFKTKQVIARTKESMFKTLKTKDNSLTMEDVESYYEMLGDKDFDSFNEKIGASAMWAIIDDAISEGDNQNQFLKRLSNFITLNDVDLRKKAINLFNKYV